MTGISEVGKTARGAPSDSKSGPCGEQPLSSLQALANARVCGPIYTENIALVNLHTQLSLDRQTMSKYAVVAPFSHGFQSLLKELTATHALGA